MPIDLNQCDQICTGCVRGYKKKHKDEPSFVVSCKGIPLEYIPGNVLALLPEADAASAVAMLDPVTWAGQVLDWYCLDVDGSIWKKKSEENRLPQGVVNYYDNIPAANARIAAGKSPFHRPYQAEMLRCSAKRKIFRIGRQAGKTETLVVSMLHAIFTNKNFKVLLLTPYSSQIEMIFTRIEEFLNANSLLYNSKKRLVKAPNHTLELYNGSHIRGFTAGTQSKGEAAQIRGQSANMLVFDEADYLSRADMDAALAVTINFPNATVWMSSTPSGKREKFYDNCKSKVYKEFHFPSHVNPNFTPEIERDLFENQGMTELGYKHEILAEFGDILEGVFKSGYVDTAMSWKYQYAEMRRTPGWRYCLGVDWNDTKIGTTICVVGYSSGEDKFYIVDRLVVSKDKWTQTAACQAIVELNRKWIPDFIYIDKGYGSTQLEILHGHGYSSIQNNGANHVDSRLTRIVKAYDFGSTVEIRDLFTKQVVKKHSKPFLVENTIRRFESNQVYISNTDKQLEGELRGYVIDRISMHGLPVFKQGNEKLGDHNLDAFMLALVAFELEMTAFGKPSYNPHIAFSGRLGEVMESPAQVGDIIIKNERAPEARSRRAAEQKPLGNRTQNVVQDNDVFNPQNPLPGANMNNAIPSSPKLWSWDGFNRDQPAPKSKTLFRKTSKPPTRKKF